MMLLRRLSAQTTTLLILFVIGSFLRLWNFSNTLQFLGDQGRDAIIVKHIIKDFDPVLIGPVTSTGNMYLGPLYYYFMAPFLAISYPSPLGPAYGVAILSIITLVALYYLSKEFVGETAALIATWCFSISAVVITYSRFSWNPNPAPFFSLVLIWSVYRALRKSPWYWVLSSVCIAVLIQLHYVTLLTLPATGIFWLYDLYLKWKLLKAAPKNQQAVRSFQALLQSTVVAIVLFLIFLSPLVLFDFRHQFLNWHSFQNFVKESQGTVNSTTLMSRFTKIAMETHGRSLQALFEVSIGQNRTLNTLLIFVVFGIMLWTIIKSKPNPHRLGQIILLTYMVISIVGLAFYRGSVFVHYIAYLFPITFLLFGVVLAQLSRKFVGALLAGVFLIGFGWWNFHHMPLKSLGWTVTKMENVSKTIYQRVKPGEKYNLVLLSSSHDLYAQNYRYFLVASDKPPVNTDDFAQAHTLFIINEERVQTNVTQLPIYEIQVFPNKKVSEVYTIPNGPEITVLRTTP
jgi:4-amino-4-deoxy-L-arabinose transferase-like glycosyltransferase